LKTGLISIALFSAVIQTASANDLYIDISEESAMIRGEATHSSHGLLYFGSLHITEDKGEAISIGLMKSGQIGSNANLTGDLGIKGYVIDPDADNVYALALGGRLNYAIQEVEGLSVTGELFYAPSITVSSDIENVIDLHVRANYALFEKGELYAGVRNYKLGLENQSDYKFDTGPFFGIQLSF